MTGDQAFALGWSLAGLAIAIILILSARRLGSGKAAAWLVVVGLVVLAFFVLVGWIAMTAFRRGERWARRALTAAWVLAAVTIVTTLFTVSARGLPGSIVGEMAGRTPVGWEQLGVGLLAWGAGLWLMRSARHAPEPVRSGG